MLKKDKTISQKKFCQKKGILNGEVKIKYHIDCRKSYTSSQNIDHDLQSDSGAGPSNYSGTRFKSDCFNIRTMCLICNTSGTKKKKKLVSVQTGKLNNIMYLYSFYLYISLYFVLKENMDSILKYV